MDDRESDAARDRDSGRARERKGEGESEREVKQRIASYSRMGLRGWSKSSSFLTIASEKFIHGFKRQTPN